MTNDEIVHRYTEAYRTNDLATMAALRHPDWSVDYPQSGERVRGSANMAAIMSAYPGGAPELVRTHVVGAEDRYVLTPMFTFERIAGAGDQWWADGVATYPDGSTWFFVVLIELRDGRIYHETEYFGQPFEAPAWRAAWTERMDEGV